MLRLAREPRRENYRVCYARGDGSRLARMRAMCEEGRRWAGDTYERQLRASCDTILGPDGELSPAAARAAEADAPAWGPVLEALADSATSAP